MSAVGDARKRLAEAAVEVSTYAEWRVETNQTEDDFGTDEQSARDWLARSKDEPDWLPAELMSRTVTVTTTPWTLDA